MYATTNATTNYLLNHLIYLFQAANSQDPKSVKPPETKPQDYLPFPEILKNFEDELLEPKTKEILITLLKSRRIPKYVYSALIDPPKKSPTRQ